MNNLLSSDTAGFPMSTKVQEFLDLLQYPEVQEALQSIVHMTIHETPIYKRLDLIEEHLGANDLYCVGRDIDYERGVTDDEREPLRKIPDQIAVIHNLIQTPVKEVVMVSGNVTEIRARLLREKIDTVSPRQGKKFILSTEVQQFLLFEVPEEQRTTEKGARVAAGDVIKKAIEMFPESLQIGKTKGKGLRFIELIEGLRDM